MMLLPNRNLLRGLTPANPIEVTFGAMLGNTNETSTTSFNVNVATGPAVEKTVFLTIICANTSWNPTSSYSLDPGGRLANIQGGGPTASLFYYHTSNASPTNITFNANGSGAPAQTLLATWYALGTITPTLVDSQKIVGNSTYDFEVDTDRDGVTLGQQYRGGGSPPVWTGLTIRDTNGAGGVSGSAADGEFNTVANNDAITLSGLISDTLKAAAVFSLGRA